MCFFDCQVKGTESLSQSQPPQQVTGSCTSNVNLRDEKYKAKNIIDTAVFRGGDVAWSWAFTGLRGLAGTYGAAMVAIPIMLGWLVLALALGRAQERAALTIKGEDP